MVVQNCVGKPRREQTTLLRDGDCEAGGSPSFTGPNLLESLESPSPIPADL